MDNITGFCFILLLFEKHCQNVFDSIAQICNRRPEIKGKEMENNDIQWNLRSLRLVDINYIEWSS